MRLSLGFRVFIGFLIINLLYIAVLIIAIVRLNDVGQKSRVFSDVYLPLYKYVQRIESSRGLKHEELKKALELKNSEEKINAIEAYATSFENTNNELLTRIKSLVEISKKLLYDSGEEKSYQQLVERIASLEQKSELYSKAIERLSESMKLGIYPGPIDYWVPVDNSENTLKREQKILIMQVEGLMRLLINRIGSVQRAIRWQLIIFTILAFMVSVVVVLVIENRLKRINRFSDLLSSMVLRGEFKPVNVVGDDEVSDFINNINKLTSELMRIQKETEGNRDQLIAMTSNLRRMNSELLFLKSYNESIINSIRSSIIILNEKFTIVRFNPMAKNMFKISEECIDKDFFSVFKSLDNADLRLLIKDAIASKRMSVLQEVPFSISDAQMRLNIQIAPFLGESEELKGVVVMIEDVTEIVKTRRLLSQSERLATIGRMAAQLTHQIKNPLSTISLNIELLQEDTEKGKIEKEMFLKKLVLIRREIEELIRMSNEYLQFARISDSRPEDIDINLLIKSIIEFYDMECRSKRIDVEQRLSSDTGSIKGDVAQLKQAIINIFVNAMESLRDGGRIVISTSRKDGYVRIEISDNGKGIEEVMLKYIFDPFYSSKEGGAGLGLSIASQIIEQMGGKIECHNNADSGAIFTINLPI